jgi:LmbE family N-acetylglucosaminyl deacetylase
MGVKANHAKMIQLEKELVQQREKMTIASADYGKAWDEIKKLLNDQAPLIDRLPPGDDRANKQNALTETVTQKMDAINADKSYLHAKQAIEKLQDQQTELAKQTVQLIGAKLKKTGLTDEKKKFYTVVEKVMKDLFHV